MTSRLWKVQAKPSAILGSVRGTTKRSRTRRQSGFSVGPAQENFDGDIDQVRIWDVALSQQEIQQYMNCPPTGNESGLVGYWNFEEGSGTTTYDQTSNGNNGILVNGPTWSNNTPSQSCSLTNSNGCDSTAILNLTINQGDTSYTNITSCDSVVWNGTTYTQSGAYTYTGNNYSLDFDMYDDYVEFTSPIIPTNGDITVMAWSYCPYAIATGGQGGSPNNGGYGNGYRQILSQGDNSSGYFIGYEEDGEMILCRGL